MLATEVGQQKIQIRRASLHLLTLSLTALTLFLIDRAFLDSLSLVIETIFRWISIPPLVLIASIFSRFLLYRP